MSGVVMLKPLRGKLKLKNVNHYITLKVSGEITISKGKFTTDINFWGELSGSNHKGYYGFDDFDFERGISKIDGVVIDNLSNFTQSFRDSGLSAVANSFEIEHDEIRQMCYKSVETMPEVIEFFGANFKCFDALSKDEKNLVKVRYVIDNYGTSDDWAKKQFGIKLDEGQEVATLEQLIEYRDNLIK